MAHNIPSKLFDKFDDEYEMKQNFDLSKMNIKGGFCVDKYTNVII